MTITPHPTWVNGAVIPVNFYPCAGAAFAYWLMPASAVVSRFTT